MTKKTGRDACCSPSGGVCCKVEAIVTADERGQMVLPKEVRDQADIRAGDKLALISWAKGSKSCCLVLIKADNLTAMVGAWLGPLLDKIPRK